MTSVLHPTGSPGEKQMTVLTDIANAMNSYPLDETAIEILEPVLESGTAGVINVNEVWKFKVKVTNNGHLNMTDVILHVNGTNGTTISKKPTTGFTEKTIKADPLTVNGGGGSSTTGYLYFTAPSTQKPADTPLLESHIFDFNANFDHFFTNHTPDEDHATVSYPSGTYKAQVQG
jgi:hypothetical protein